MSLERAQRFFPALVALLTLLAFLPALRNEFVNFDDLSNLVLNPSYRGLGWPQLKWMWTSQVIGRYVPITWMTLGLDYILWGMNPLGYHLTSLLIHAANGVLFYFVALAIYRLSFRNHPSTVQSRLPQAALFASLLFSVHPLRVESVAWVTERRDVVSGFFYLLALLAYLRAFESDCRPDRRLNYWASFVFFALSILSKEIAVTLPIVLLVLDVYPLRRLGGSRGWWSTPEARMAWFEKAPFLLLSLADGILALVVAARQEISNPPAGLGLLPRFAESVYSLAFYLWKTIAPFHLSPFYPLTPHKIDPWAVPFQISLAAVLVVTAAAVFLRRRFPALLAVWVAYTVTLAPVLGIVYNGLQITADRYSYLACLGWALLAGAAPLAWKGRARIAVNIWIPAAATLVVLTLSTFTWRQVQVWRDSDTLWSHALSVEPSFLAYTSMGSVLMERGDNLSAIDHFRLAIALKPDYWLPYYNLASCLADQGHWDQASRELEIAVSLQGLGQDMADVENALGLTLLRQNRLDDAIGHFRKAVEARPTFEKARGNLERAMALKKAASP